MTDTDHLKSLGENSVYQIAPEPVLELLERFRAPTCTYDENPINAAQKILIEVPEFTSLCPKTGQPDFAKIIIEYQPNLWCVESKSLKVYMMAYRNFGEFHEACVNRMMKHLVQLLSPKQIMVQGQFTPRGGIKFWPTSEWHQK